MPTEVMSPPVGVALLAEGRFDEALAALRRAIELGDNSPATLLNLAIAEGRAADPKRARALIRSVAVRAPDWDEPMLRLAENLRAAGEITEAAEVYQHVLELNPDRPEALIALGGLLLMRGDTEKARDVLLRGCGVVPGNAEAWNTARPGVPTATGATSGARSLRHGATFTARPSRIRFE